MGAHICPNAQNISQNEVTMQKKPKIDISKPPKIHKLQPINKLNFPEEIMDIQRERQYSIPKQTTQDQSTSKQDINDNRIEPLEQFEGIQVNLQENQKDQQNDSRDDSNSALLEVKYKPILKHPPSPRNCQNDGESQKSVKKVTFDKKQKVIYSSFRKPKQ
ncbi:unnamed protein product [Paramecium pentaurelia]|uniref:Uncharacterized protein n=1 Tax=Paramecium pentaurelia TaxID=43138 RepID=A0A8S1XNV9_9CILI|nr:unnamed protein product [Paramecium pentaurelia]